MLQETLLLGLGVILGAMLSSFLNSCAAKKRGRKGSARSGTAAAEDDDEGEWESEEESEDQDDSLHGALLKRNAAPKKMTD